jgi:hypothetical protein
MKTFKFHLLNGNAVTATADYTYETLVAQMMRPNEVITLEKPSGGMVALPVRNIAMLEVL